MVKIITDSTCDISKIEQINMGIEVMPLMVNFGEESYKDGIEITRSEFYERLEKVQELPTTSQVNPAEFEESFQKAIDNGDEVVAILISSELSGTFQSAKIAVDSIESDKIYLVDSTTASFGLALLVKEAVRLRDAGLSAKEIAEKIEELAKRVRLVAFVDTLKYLKMGGRLSATSAMIGSFLGIHPVLKVQDGKIHPVGKARSIKSGLRKLHEFLQEEPADYSFGFSFGHSNARDRINSCIEFFTPIIETKDYLVCNIGSVVGTHTGPGVMGVAYITKK